MSRPQPWESGDELDRWNGYLDFERIDGEVGYPVLRNLVDASSYRELRVREDEFAAIRAETLRAEGIPASYDLEGLRDVHRHLFQDVYAWAGEVRTVNIMKGAPFAPPDIIEPMMDALSQALRESDMLRAAQEKNVPAALAEVYDTVNTAHPFREGNGRTQRIFVAAIAAESGHRLDWTRVGGERNNEASEKARTGDKEDLRAMFETITTKTPQARHDAWRPGRGLPSEATRARGEGSLPGERSYRARQRPERPRGQDRGRG